jgi:hypothetical protein
VGSLVINFGSFVAGISKHLKPTHTLTVWGVAMGKGAWDAALRSAEGAAKHFNPTQRFSAFGVSSGNVEGRGSLAGASKHFKPTHTFLL